MGQAEDDFPIVDPHQHFWDLERNYSPWLSGPVRKAFRYGDYSAICRTYMPPDYRCDAGANRVVKTVHIEAMRNNDPVGETRWLEEVAAEHGLPSAIVGEVAFADGSAAEILAGHAASPLARGVRNYPAAAADARDAKRGQPGSMDDAAWRRGYALMERHGFSFDLQTPWWHLDAGAELAADFPRIQIIVLHTGLPADRSPEGLAGWRKAMDKVAREPNVALKISGLGRKGLPWTLEANGPIIGEAIAIFGVERCMFASNYPVDSLAGPFATIYDGFRATVADRPQSERRKLFHDNAVRLYRL
jgi:predicted TIM-barrel fold metal-dependent hydrolase